LLKKIERTLGRFAIPNLTIILVVGQVICYVAAIPDPHRLDVLQLIPNRAIQGEYWRFITFLFIPGLSNPLFFLFGMYFFYLMGTALENEWGSFRYNVYVFIAAVMAVAAAWVAPDAQASNVYIGTSIFLAFAFLYPDFTIYLFFILPVKIKWVALVTWVMLGVVVLIGAWLAKALVVASVANFFLFFGKDIVQMMRSRRRRMVSKFQELPNKSKPFHACAVCGITDKSHPTAEFRYCPSCDSSLAYCLDHIQNHEHRGKTATAGESK